MTRQEYEQKAADGTLTVGDILNNREYATPEQVEGVTGSIGAISKRLRTERDVKRMVAEVAKLVMQLPTDMENAAIVEQWADVSGDGPAPPESFVLVEQCGNIGDRVTDLLNRGEEIPQELHDGLVTVLETLIRVLESSNEDPNKVLEDPNKETNDTTSDVKACNTDCLAYARGTCGYINAAKLSQPAEAYNLKDKRTCPRYRAIYPERSIS